MKPIVTLERFLNSKKQLKRTSVDFAKRVLPLVPSAELSSIVAALMSDGHLEFNKHSRPKKIILYSDDRRACVWFLKIVKKVFGVTGELHRYTSSTGYDKGHGSYKAFVNNAALARVLFLAGVPPGDKVAAAFRVPDWIRNGSAEIQKAFLSTFFEFEGCIPFLRGGRNTWSTYILNCKIEELKRSALIYFSDFRSMLLRFGIRTSNIHVRYSRTRKKDGKRSLAFYLFISGKESIVNFYRFVGFIFPRKQRALRRAVSHIVRTIRLEPTPERVELLNVVKSGETDREASSRLSKFALSKYSERTYEHMRRGESLIPADLLFACSTLSGQKIPDLEKGVHGFLFEEWKNQRSSRPATKASSFLRASSSVN